MKIAILTQPTIATNYGCILQAFALQYFLKQLGYESETVNLDDTVTGIDCFFRYLKKSIAKLLNIQKSWNWHNLIRPNDYEIITSNNLSFLNKNLRMTKEKFKSYRLLDPNKDLLKYDTFIVGSDQVWRCKNGLNNYVRNCMLQFAFKRQNIKRISYAASFGVDSISTNAKDIKDCKKLLSVFDAISVRENSAVDICKKQLGVDATQVIDPTMLLDHKLYENIANESNPLSNNGDLFAYILDMTEEKRNIISSIASIKSLLPFQILPEISFDLAGPKYIKQCVMPSVEQWLSCFKKAKFVITDSFHGSVFSILFKKPFIAIGNPSRGMTRFTSLLKLFELEDQLIFNLNDITNDKVFKSIDYDKVFKILEKERLKAQEFLTNALKS